MPFTSPNMSLRIWTAGSDPYDHDQLADNFFKLDQHNHGQGMGAQIGADGIADGSLLTQHFTNASIGTAFLEDASVTSRKLAPTNGLVTATSDLSLTTTPTDIAGATVSITPDIDSHLLVHGVFDLNALINSGNAAELEGLLVVDGALRTKVAKFYQMAPSSNPIARATVTQIWLVPLTAGSAHTIKLQAQLGTNHTATLTSSVKAANTCFFYTLYAG